MTLYNEFDPFAAAWLTRLIEAVFVRAFMDAEIFLTEEVN